MAINWKRLSVRDLLCKYILGENSICLEKNKLCKKPYPLLNFISNRKLRNKTPSLIGSMLNYNYLLLSKEEEISIKQVDDSLKNKFFSLFNDNNNNQNITNINDNNDNQNFYRTQRIKKGFTDIDKGKILYTNRNIKINYFPNYNKEFIIGNNLTFEKENKDNNEKNKNYKMKLNKINNSSLNNLTCNTSKDNFNVNSNSNAPLLNNYLKNKVALNKKTFNKLDDIKNNNKSKNNKYLSTFTMTDYRRKFDIKRIKKIKKMKEAINNKNLRNSFTPTINIGKNVRLYTYNINKDNINKLNDRWIRLNIIEGQKRKTNPLFEKIIKDLSTIKTNEHLVQLPINFKAI